MDVEKQTERDMLRYAVHELRNIFCVMIGNLELLRYRADPNSLIKIERALSGAERGDAVIALLANLQKNQVSLLD